jgi:hypothetical protein
MEFRPVREMRATKCHVHISVLQRWKPIRLTALGKFTLLYRLPGNVIYDLPLINERCCKASALDAVFLLTLETCEIRHICYFLLYSMSPLSTIIPICNKLQISCHLFESYFTFKKGKNKIVRLTDKLWVFVSVSMYRKYAFFFAVALQPNAGHDLLILYVSRSHTTTQYIR